MDKLKSLARDLQTASGSSYQACLNAVKSKLDLMSAEDPTQSLQRALGRCKEAIDKRDLAFFGWN